MPFSFYGKYGAVNSYNENNIILIMNYESNKKKKKMLLKGGKNPEIFHFLIYIICYNY